MPEDLPRASLTIGAMTQAAAPNSYCWARQCVDVLAMTPEHPVDTEAPVRAHLRLESSVRPSSVSYVAFPVTDKMVRDRIENWHRLTWNLPHEGWTSDSLRPLTDQDVAWNLSPGTYVVIIGAQWGAAPDGSVTGDSSHGFLIRVQPSNNRWRGP